ncbi:MAG: DUF2314 domain-containing protein [Chitinophagaceae bacterium]
MFKVPLIDSILGVNKIIFIAVLLSFFACKESTRASYVSKSKNGGDEVYNVETNDLVMNLAIAKAKDSYNSFLDVIKGGDTTLDDFGVKMGFETADGTEHMWLNQLHFENDTLFGVLDNDPVNATSFKAGDSLEIKKEMISDWLYVRNNKMVGGYTIKALYSGMDEEEKKEFKKNLGFEIE